MKYIVNRKVSDHPLPREAGWVIDAEKIATIPVDESLIDASEFKMDSAHPETIGEYTKIAEYCSGLTLVPKRTGFRKFLLEGLLRGSSRSPELYSSAAR